MILLRILHFVFDQCLFLDKVESFSCLLPLYLLLDLLDLCFDHRGSMNFRVFRSKVFVALRNFHSPSRVIWLFD